MIRTGAQYGEGLRDGREVWIDGERVKDICAHRAVMPIVDVRAAAFASDPSRQWLEKFYGANEAWEDEDRRKLLAFALRARCRRAVRQGQAIAKTCCPTMGIIP